MRRILSLIVLAAALIVTVACSKGKDSLVGTKWVATVESETVSISFTTETTCLMVNGTSESSETTYSYSKPNITIYPPKGIVGAEPVKGTIDGKEMRLSKDGELVIFYKQ